MRGKQGRGKPRKDKVFVHVHELCKLSYITVIPEFCKCLISKVLHLREPLFLHLLRITFDKTRSSDGVSYIHMYMYTSARL